MSERTTRWANNDRAGKHSALEQHAWGIGYEVGQDTLRFGIEAILLERMNDLKACHKKDDCGVRADSISVALCDIAYKLGGYCLHCKEEHEGQNE